MKKLFSIVLALLILVSSTLVVSVLAADQSYVSFSKFSSWELETAPTVMPETIEVWFNIDANNTATTLSLFGNYGRNNSYIPSIELWLGRKQNADTGNYYYLPRLEYYNVKDWGFDNRAKAYYLNGCVIEEDRWNHLVVTRDEKAGKLYCYLNNTLVQTVSNATLKFADFVTEDTYAVGGRLSTPNNSYFNGDIASIAVYSDTRTEAEISSSYSATESSKDLTKAVEADDSALICAYDLYVAADCERIENAKTGGVALIENMWAEASDPDDYAYSFAVVGDTQKTAEYDVLNGTSYTGGIYDYINNNATDKKIAHVFGLGDITDDSRAEEWELVRAKTDALSVPYSMITGNHDPEDDFNTYYGAGTPYAAQVAGHFGSEYTHTYHTFTAGTINYLVVALGWDPSDAELDWANGVIEAHPNHSVIVTTHAYLFKDGDYVRAEKVDPSPKYNDGADIWNELVKHHENIVLVLSGHISDDRIVMKKSTGEKGNTITELLINPQGMDEGLSKAGDIPTAMVAMLYFSADGKSVDLRYYSTSKNTYFKSNNQFSFSLEKHIGEKNKPLIKDAATLPIVADGNKADFYDGLTVRTTFTGGLEGTVTSYSSTTSYSSVEGTYYGDTAGSLAVNISGFGSTLDGKKYGGAQVGQTHTTVAAANVSNASYAFWVNAPEDLYMRVYLFAYRHNGTSGDINFYSTEFKVNKGENIVEIPFSNFTVNSANYVDSTRGIQIYANRFYFRSAEADITGKTVYIDNIGIYHSKTVGYDGAEHKANADIVENFDGATVGTTTSDVWIHGNSASYISTTLVGEVGSDNAYAEGGVGQSLKVATLDGVDLNTTSRRFDLPNFKDTLCDDHGYSWGEKATLSIWIRTDREITLKVGAGASVKWNAATGANHWFCEPQTIKAGESILRIPISSFTNKQGGWSGYADAPDWSAYIGRLIFFVSSKTAGPLEMYIDNIAIECPVIGDISGDGERDILDIVALNSTLIKLSEADCYSRSTVVGDANCDGEVDRQDMIYLKTCSLGVTDYKNNVYEVVEDGPMTDGAADTYWTPATTEETIIGIKTDTVTFDTIDIKEYLDFDEDATDYTNNSYVNKLVVDAKINGKFVELCRLDEVGTRSVLLDKSYTANEFRISLTLSDDRGGISEITFRQTDSATLSTNAAGFRNVGYFTAGALDTVRTNFYDKIGGYTDIIMFDYGSWNEKGEFLWGSMKEGIDEAHLASTLSEIRAQDGGSDLNIWFCLQNYNKTAVTDTETLFATEESREALSDFAVSLCEKYGLSGIDIDYEYPETKTAWVNYGEFIVLCAEKLHQKGYKMSAAFSCFGIANITADIQGSLDYVNMMVYDMYDALGRHSPYSLARRFNAYYTELGFKPDQLVLGLPFYSKTLETVDGKHQFGGNGYMGLYDNYAEILTPDTNLIKSASGQWTYSFNGVEMIEDKVLYALENNMGGVFCWSLSVDVPSNNEKGIKSLGQTVIDTINRFK